LPTLYLQNAPSGGRHWLITMTEGSEMPDGWAEIINKRDVERVIVPCEHNAKVFREGGVKAPVHIIPGGTDPDEFELLSDWMPDRGNRPYTFLALADRGNRKGWGEVYQAFYKAFGSRDDTPDVRLIIKARPESNDTLALISQAENLDPRLTILQTDVDNMAEVYAMADCFAIPSRSEGWGMPMREAAMMGIPVITQAYSGMDDGHTECWSLPIYGGTMERIPSTFENIKGQWLRADVDALAEAMRWHYLNPANAESLGRSSADWLRKHQTWDDSAAKLMALIEEYT